MRALFLFPAFALLAAAGCSSSSSGASADGPASSGDATSSGTTGTSGSRLRAKYATSGDARQLIGFFDMQRQEDCTFRPAEPGHIRCLPADAVVANGNTAGFSDAACQVSLVAAPTTGCATPTYVVNEQYDVATCVMAPFEIRKVLPASAPFYLVATDGSGTCSAAPASTASTGLKLGDTIAWTEFAEGTVTNVAGALTEKRIGTTDGASTTYGYHLDALDADCRFRVMSDGAARCVPDAQAGPLLYGDSACTQPAAVSYYNTTPLPTGCGGSSSSNGPLLWIADGTKGGDAYTQTLSCTGINAVYKLLTTSDEDTVYESATPSMQNENQSCISSGGGGYIDPNTRALGAEISAMLPSAARVGSGGGRLVTALVLATADDQTSVLVPGFHDTQLDLDCTFVAASDGKLRCLPTAPAAQVLFKDDKCTATVVLLGPDCTSSGTKRYGRLTSATCPETTTVYALADTAQDYATGSGLTGNGGCVKVSGINSGYDATVADPAQFAEGTLFTE